MNKTTDVIIIGAGAAGLMCAIESAKRGRRVVIIEKSDKAGKKILISGGGRCNFTNINASDKNFISHNSHFCKSALARYTPFDFMDLMNRYELSWSEKTLGQLFCDQKSKAIVSMLLSECEKYGVEIKYNVQINAITHSDQQFGVNTRNDHFIAESLVVACGGPSIPKMGASDFAVQIAKQFSIKSYPFRPALVPLTFHQHDYDQYFKSLAGVSFDAVVSTQEMDFKEATLITHKGLSGPAILQISSYWQKDHSINIDLFPERDIESELIEEKQAKGKQALSAWLKKNLPDRLVERLMSLYFTDKLLSDLSHKECQSIANQLKAWQFQPSGSEGMRTAEVAIGGIDTNELSSKTMQATKVDGLYFIGESVDVTGHLGGYNFQWAWASAWCAGQYC